MPPIVRKQKFWNVTQDSISPKSQTLAKNATLLAAENVSLTENLMDKKSCNVNLVLNKGFTC